MQEKSRKQIPLDNCTWTRVPSICTGSDALEKKWKMSLCLFPQTLFYFLLFFFFCFDIVIAISQHFTKIYKNKAACAL